MTAHRRTRATTAGFGILQNARRSLHRAVCVLVPFLIAMASAEPVQARGKPKSDRQGVFGKLVGSGWKRTFKALDVSDGPGPSSRNSCVTASIERNSFFNGFTLGATECIPNPKSRRLTRRRYEHMLLACMTFDLSRPWTMPCVAEFGDHGPRSVAVWRPTVATGPTGAFSSFVQVQIDSVEGGIAVGTITGIFDAPDTPTQKPREVVITSMTFRVPYVEASGASGATMLHRSDGAR